MMRALVALSLVLVSCSAVSVRQQRSFPEDFVFGVATASYQIEGGWDSDGKGENIWDRITHTNPEWMFDQTTGDVAADSYNNYKRDVEMMRELGISTYRFSLSWSRILPNGFSNEINEAGVQFYNNYIDEMLKYGITPMITLYHWDLPQKLQDLGGFMNPLIADWFEDYARVVYEKFGDRVKQWITFNEPREICYEGYGSDTKAPALRANGIGEYICAKNLVMAHAKAYRVFDNEFRAKYGGTCGITISVAWVGSLTDSEEDRFAAELRKQSEFGLYSEPIFSAEGGFPKEFAERVAQKSKEQGYSRSRLPDFTEEEKAFVKGTSDFFGVNHYSGYYAFAVEYTPGLVPSLYDDTGDVGGMVYDDWPRSASSWLIQAPDSIYHALMDLKERYNNPTIYITENGWSTYPNAGLDDEGRINFYRAALESVLDTLDAGVNLKGYMAWSLMDNFEWQRGYSERFGLYNVDFEDPARTRTPRKSAFIYKEIIRSRTIDHNYEPPSLTMTIDEGH